jgi:hypothetical protein
VSFARFFHCAPPLHPKAQKNLKNEQYTFAKTTLDQNKNQRALA